MSWYAKHSIQVRNNQDASQYGCGKSWLCIAGRLEVGRLVIANGGRMKESKLGHKGKDLTWVSDLTPERENSRALKRSSSSLSEQERWGIAHTKEQNGLLLDELASKQDHLARIEN